MIEICPHNNCTGCSACASICPHRAISMVTDELAFKRPHIDASHCVDCGICKKVCPAINEPVRNDRLQEERFYAAYHKDDGIRMGSSSGGAFSALASVVLKRGGYVCAASFDNEYRKVKHVIIDDEKELQSLRTSKYTQSDMGNCMSEVRALLRAGQEVFFTGTPCQVAGLHLFLRKEYPNLTTADIVCHGVPSPHIYVDYVEFLEKKYGSKIETYNFRDKRWSWWRFNMKASFRNGKTYYGKWETDPFFRGFLNDYFLRESCYQCRFNKHIRYADITLSDFWGYRAEGGGFPDDDKGISMCMINTKKGEMLFQSAREFLIHCARPREMSLANGGFLPRQVDIQERNNFLDKYWQIGFAGCLDSYFKPVKPSRHYLLLYFFGRESTFLKLYSIARKLISRKLYASIVYKIWRKIRGV